MGDLINLRRARKSKLRTEKEAQASENRAKFGRPIAALKLQKAQRDQNRKALDGHRITPIKDQPE